MQQVLHRAAPVSAKASALVSTGLTAGNPERSRAPPPSAIVIIVLDALVVLGCRIDKNGRLGAAAARRAARAALAYHAGAARLVLVSGGRRWRGVAEADAIARELEAAGVPHDAIVRELRSLSTLGNARESARLLAQRNLKSVAVVTCDWHTARALACFEFAGVRASALPAPSPHVGPLQRAFRGALERLSWAVDHVLGRSLRAREAM